MARTFNGTSDRVDLASLSKTLGTPVDWTVSAWYRPTGTPRSHANSYALEGVVADASGYWGIYRGIIPGQLGSADAIWIYTYDGTEKRCGFNITVNSLIHVAHRRRASTGNIELFVGGVQRDQVASGVPQVMTGIVSIGRGWTGDSTWAKGDISEVSSWSVALSDSEILALARGASPSKLRPRLTQGSGDTFKLYSPLQGVFSPENDHGPEHRTLTVIGTTRAGSHAPIAGFIARPFGYEPILDIVALPSVIDRTLVGGIMDLSRLGGYVPRGTGGGVG